MNQASKAERRDGTDMTVDEFSKGTDGVVVYRVLLSFTPVGPGDGLHEGSDTRWYVRREGRTL